MVESATMLLFFSHMISLAVQKDVDPSTLLGHLQPLGLQGPKHPVDELTEFPDPETFYRRYSRNAKPLLIKGAAKKSPAFSLWTDDYFLNREESPTVEVEVEFGKKENRSGGTSAYTMRRFVETYKTSDVYMVSSVPGYIRPDLLLPSCLHCGGFQKRLVAAVMWFSSGGTKSLLHNDNVDNINCLFAGSKELYFVEYPKYKKQVNLDNRMGSYSAVDVDRVNLTKYPGLQNVEFHYARMEAGDCLYIPYKWYHQVRSYDRNIAVNVWWTPLLEFNTTDCKHSKVKGLPTFDKYNFLKEEDDLPEANDMKEYFQNLLGKDTSTTLDQLITKMQSDTSLIIPGLGWVAKLDEVAGKLFDVLDVDKDSFVTQEDFDSLDDVTVDRLSDVATELEEALDEQLVAFGGDSVETYEDNDVVTGKAGKAKEEL